MSNLITNLCRGYVISPTQKVVAVSGLVMTPAQKAVLMCLADRADDAGVAWPSIPAICLWTGLGRTAVILAHQFLEGKGFFTADREKGRTSRIAFNIPLLESLNQSASRTTSEEEEGQNQSASRTGTDAEPVRETDTYQSASRTTPVRETDTSCPAAVPNTSIHHQYIKKTPKSKRVKPSISLLEEFPDLLQGIDEQILRDWQQLMKTKRGAITRTHLEDKVREGQKLNMTLGEVLAFCCVQNWQGFKAKWVNNLNQPKPSAYAPSAAPSRHTGFTPDKYEEIANAGIPA